MRGASRDVEQNKFHLITLDINIVKHPWFSPYICRNRVMLERRSVDFKSISIPFMCVRSGVLCVATVFICNVMELSGIVTSLLTYTIAGASALYR